jgi:uncharacterized protein YdhG (YjbR/CyaY superfamily)
MKRAASRKGKAARSRTKPKTVDEYLVRVPEPARSTLNKIRSTIRSAVPAETAEVISYGIPAFKFKQVVVWYAAFSDHCSLVPTASVIDMFKDELNSYPISKGTIDFPVDKPLPATLLKKMVKARLRQIEGKKPH